MTYLHFIEFFLDKIGYKSHRKHSVHRICFIFFKQKKICKHKNDLILFQVKFSHLLRHSCQEAYNKRVS